MAKNAYFQDEQCLMEVLYRTPETRIDTKIYPVATTEDQCLCIFDEIMKKSWPIGAIINVKKPETWDIYFDTGLFFQTIKKVGNVLKKEKKCGL